MKIREEAKGILAILLNCGPGVNPGNNPAEHHLTKLVYAFSEEALISGQVACAILASQ